MTLTQVWGVLIIFIVCPLIGGLPLIRWIVALGTGPQLSQIGTGNISVSAAFYHGGRVLGILAACAEAAKGIAAVLLARQFFPMDPAWEMIALIALVMGRYWFAHGAGTTNVFWGYLVHDPIAAGLVFILSGVSFTVLRERQLAKFGVLVILPIITALRHPDDAALIVATMCVAGLLGWIYLKIPDDLELDPSASQAESRAMLQFFRGDRALQTLDQPLAVEQFGQKAATLAQLKRLGCPVPHGVVLVAGDDPDSVLTKLEPSPKQPVIVRSSAVGEDSEAASAAGQYESISGITSREALPPAIARCFASYHRPAAVEYRRSRHLPDQAMAVIIQQQIRGVFSGVAFSRDPITRHGAAVLIEALPGNAAQVVSGQTTPESYRVEVPETLPPDLAFAPTWQRPPALNFAIDGQGTVPAPVLQQVAYLARWVEAHYHGIPQDVEWTFDGQTVWLLQARPVTTLQPLWTRKIAAEVIPGVIRPLTWSINRPLTCGVWGEIFTLVLGDRAQGLEFEATATLHFSRAYFNATLLGQIFRRMGLPAESLEFLTRGAKFSKPPLWSTVQNIPGLLRLARREFGLIQAFQRDRRQSFDPILATLSAQPPESLTAPALLERIDTILQTLKQATFYSILAPLSAALRQAIAKVDAATLDNHQTPEIGATRSLQTLAQETHARLTEWGWELQTLTPTTLLTQLETQPAGQAILARLEQIIAEYGYLSEVGTDIAIPTWREQPQPIRELFAQFCLNPPPSRPLPAPQRPTQVQQRVNLKGQVTEVYSRLLAELRWSFLALERQWRHQGRLLAEGDIFYLTLAEIRQLIEAGADSRDRPVHQHIAERQTQLERDRALEPIPFLVYGNDPPPPTLSLRSQPVAQQLYGIGASAGQVEGTLLVVTSLQALPTIAPNTIIVVPYTDSGWVPLLAQASGLIAEVGGRLSHGAIIAREYQIPAVMDLPHATQILQTGQRVRLDGQRGTVEVLADESTTAQPLETQSPEA